MNTELVIGSFVHVEGNDDGVGKLVGLSEEKGGEKGGGDADVEYLASPLGPKLIVKKTRRDDLKRVELSPQTRVYCLDPSGRFLAGRLVGPITSALALRTEEDHYPVRFPNGNNVMVAESQLYVRWARPIDDPLDYLAARVTETPFFYTCRTGLVRHLATQRAAFAGLSGLASAAIELMEHQVTAIRRVARDPVQRYLLADAAGLGKTLEAGVLIRQHLQESKGAQVLILAPKSALVQWQRELEDKLLLEGDPRVILREEPPADDSRAPTLLVIDVAHRFVKGAFATNAAERQRYEALAALARRAPRLLLLSAMPIVDNEDAYLAMLHLLDPAAYPLNDRPGFAKRVRDRQDIAELVANLRDEASDAAAAGAIDQALSLHPHDPTLAELATAARAALGSKKSAQKTASRRALRTHLIETHRIERRLLRTRRDDPRLEDHLPKRNGVTPLSGEDSARVAAFDFLEVWRQAALRAAPKDRHAPLSTLFAQWVEAALSHPRVLLRRVDARLKRPEPPFFTGEEELLRAQKSQLGASLSDDARVKQLVQWIAAQPKSRKAVLFVDDAEVADFISARLREALLPDAVIRYDGVDAGRRFEDRAPARVLVCDAAGEESLSLQKSAPTLVHYDLPLSPARIERRIARRERIAARGRVNNLVYSSAAVYEREWRACLENAIRVFHRSVTPLAPRLRESLARILEQLFRDGATAITAEAARLADKAQGLDVEQARSEKQAALDETDCADADEHALFEKLEEADESFEESGRLAFEEWMVRCLQFLPRSEEDVLRYVYSLARPTLLPLDDALAWFASLIDHGIAERTRSELPLLPCTFVRAVAESEQVGLMRVGHPLIDVLEPMLATDDRGCAYALWRVASEFSGPPQRFFGFDFLIAADTAPARALLGERLDGLPALRRRADEALRVDFHTVWLDGALQPISDPALIALLARPYSAEKRGGGDVNLRLERWPAADALIAAPDWPELCERARQAALVALRGDAALQKRCTVAAQTLEAADAGLQKQLRSRISALSGPAQAAEKATADLEAKLTAALSAGARAPTFHLTAAGVVYLSAEKLPDPV